MMDDPGEFEDPALRAAVRKALGNEAAPAGLRRRVAALMAAEGLAAPAGWGEAQQAPVGRAQPSSRWAELRNTRTLAIAAVTFIAVGFAVLQIVTFFDWPGSSSSPFAIQPASFPVSFATAIVSTHDHCAKLADHHFVPGDDPGALKDQLSKAEGIAVSAIHPGDGWQFKGAGLCTVEQTKAAHLLFVRGPESLSIFSLPAPSSCHESAYSEVVSKHPVIGFTSEGVLYCVIGSATQGELTLTELEPVVSKVRASVGALAGDGCDVLEFIQTAGKSASPQADVFARSH